MQNTRAMSVDGFMPRTIVVPKRHQMPEARNQISELQQKPLSESISKPAPVQIATPVRKVLTLEQQKPIQPFNLDIEEKPKAEPKKAEKMSYWAKTLDFTRSFLIVATIIVLAFFSNFLYVGQLIIGVYAVCALVLGIKSQTTFKLALASLGCIVLLTLIKPGTALAENFAVFAFLFLVVGTISMAIEVRREGQFSDITKQKFRINP